MNWLVIRVYSWLIGEVGSWSRNYDPTGELVDPAHLRWEGSRRRWAELGRRLGHETTDDGG